MRYTYTATGQRQSRADGTGTTTYGYDALDRTVAVTNGAGNSLGYGYDAVGNTTAITYPDGSQVTRSYDTLDRLNSVSDGLGHTTRFGYDAKDNPITQTAPTTVTTTIGMGYDATGRLASITDTTPITTWSFGYTRAPAPLRPCACLCPRPAPPDFSQTLGAVFTATLDKVNVP